MSEPRTARIFRYYDANLRAFQVTKFPDDPPAGDTDLERRMRHFTEIENFSFFGHELARDIGEEKLADQIMDTGINWEHFVASTNDKMIPGQPTKISDLAMQAKIDELDQQTEDLVDLVNKLSAQRPHITRRLQEEAEERSE